MNIKTLVKSFFATRLRRPVRELYLSVLIVELAGAMVAIFEPIYLYTLGFGLQKILYFYLFVYILYFLFIPFGAKFARRFGYEKAILVATPFWALLYIALYFIPGNKIFLLVAILAYVLQKTFYWPAYHADFARFGRQQERGREVGNLLAINSLVSIIGPLAGGLLLGFFGFEVLFIIVSVLILASNLPLLSTPEKFIPKPYNYLDSYRRLAARQNRRNFFGFLGFGEELVALVIWPIFIYVVVADYVGVGALVAAATLVTAIALLFIGKLSDRDFYARRAVLKTGALFTGLTWLLRLLVRGALGVFLVDTLSRINKNVAVVPMMAMTYDRAGQSSVMQTVMFFEMTLVVGKILAIVLSLLLLALFPGSYAALFILAALFSLLYSLVQYKPIKL